ncbi:sigma-70 family RNA polymerase sigma factor [Paenibacillus alvei]|uniref:Sigma-70 family RNA polymerase sigma factor n=1 Tax=Paenibacillus alvei TaxID=44250 RepID=A0ABT4GU11_PAEAL|nr:sigma-70 family RNA polymerase sigma factor [Paenibacillus alvei]MCY9542886.1 sigma-70 family RNA polymerase sigma factor [Paenibacillus alvei]MCY9706936.1 sigma-70 family RNA polymerase sigma factor [Paenibacillus alvei]MCY9735137.1 sigma-70 family RNA polymerase sigma factor [Paenibacillus alvei]MCY9753341.1 sigma-70 family RNA polymerase sigma factor [Paenibacillus alvei]MCY9760199.1 sigma-70 family RNA polymerase sigma factor [Paenibacillus alvei]
MNNKKLENLLVQCITDYKENVYRLAYSYVKNSEDALDIVQDSIHKAFLSLEKLKNTESVKSWFYRIVINTSLDLLRKQKKVQVVDESTLEAFHPAKNDVYPNIDLEEALNDLPSIYRTIIVLRYFEDLKLEEIAVVLEENLSTVKTRLYQALRILRVKMNDESTEDK